MLELQSVERSTQARAYELRATCVPRPQTPHEIENGTHYFNENLKISF